MLDETARVVKEASRPVLGAEAYADLTNEQLDELRAKTQKLIKEEKFINNACAILIAANQLYSMAIQAISRRCDMLGVDQFVETFLVRSMLAHAKREEFTRESVLKKMHQLVLPFVAAETEDEGIREKALIEKERTEEDKARRSIHIALPFQPDVTWPKPPVLPRGKLMVLMGHPGAVKFAIDQVVSHCLKAKEKAGKFQPSVLRLVEKTRQHNVVYMQKDLGNKTLFELGVNRWLNCGRSAAALRETLKPWARLLRKRRIDVLVIDNLAWALYREHLPAHVNAGACQKMLQQWAKETGCAIVAGLPVGRADQSADQVIEWSESFGHEWTQLAIYTLLVQVGTENEELSETYRLFTTRNSNPGRSVTLATGVTKAVIDDVKHTYPNEKEEKPDEQ